MAKSSLMSKMIKAAGKDENVKVLTESAFKIKEVLCTTPVHINNLMLGGNFSSGIRSGIYQVVGDSRTFKTNYCLMNVKAFLDHDPEAICVFFDSEFSAGGYFKTFGIDESRVLHVPFANIEEFKFKIAPMLEDVTLGEKVIIFCDSLSQSASKREVTNAMEQNSAADMSRAASVNSLFRVITPLLTLKKIPLFFINSFYDDINNKYADKIIKGGKQQLLSSDVLLMVTRSQEKDDKELIGWNFNYTIYKSRYVKEKSKFTITVRYDGGIDVNSNLFDLAIESGVVFAPKQGYYSINMPGYDPERCQRRSAIEKEDKFWKDLMANKTFTEYCSNKYALEEGHMFKESSEDKPEYIDLETGEIVTE